MTWPDWPVSPRRPRDRRRRPGDRPPERTPDGLFRLYHGTSATRADRIRKEGLRADHIRKIGLDTTPQAVAVFARLKADAEAAEAVVLACEIDPAWIARHEVWREGDHANLWLFKTADPFDAPRLAPPALVRARSVDLP